MDVRNCKSCGRIFNYLSGPPICEACKANVEDKFDEVKSYVRDHGQAPINQVSEDCDVSVKQLKQWIREERLQLSEESGFFLECENCGASILTGRFCDRCKAKLTTDFQGVYAKPVLKEQKKERDKDRMRFLDKN